LLPGFPVKVKIPVAPTVTTGTVTFVDFGDMTPVLESDVNYPLQ
jgi:hypothetical protein